MIRTLLSSLAVSAVFLSQCTLPKDGRHASSQEGGHQHTNALVDETSPYLLQHAHNPVDWHPWSEQTLKKAQKEDKMLIISVGYAACHWCHVMEEESFEDTAVANFMNEHFINIKVDREERPDVDQIYMDACQLINRSGGWPLNCIALPDGRPFVAKTYVPRDQWLDMLKTMVDYYQNKRGEVVQAAEQITKGVQAMDLSGISKGSTEYQMKDLTAAYQTWQSSFDKRLGGYRGSPKFPLPKSTEALLHYAVIKGDAEALAQTKLTLDQMMWGGIYDQLGGGFARYATDNLWKVPHFEKMLYDNGQLVSLYAQTYRQTKDEDYAKVVRETLAFVERELMSKEGGFYASLDADSEGEEGKFYTWSYRELADLLDAKELEIFTAIFNVKEEPNWPEGKANILYRNRDWAFFTGKFSTTQEELEKTVASARQKLFEARSQRVRPGLDDKILTSWNALMLKGYIDAYRALGERHYLDIALQNAAFISDKMRQSDHRLLRNYKAGNATINAFLDDYAFTIEAFIALYQVTFDEKWLKQADQLTQYVLAHFSDPRSNLFFYTSDLDPDLITRKIEIPDNVQPSSNSVMAKNLHHLGHYYYNQDYLDRSNEMLATVRINALEMVRGYTNWFELMLLHTQPFYEVAILGNDFTQTRTALDQRLIPNMILMGGKTEGDLELLKNKLVKGQTTIYVCQNKSCQRPVTEASQAMSQMKLAEID